MTQEARTFTLTKHAIQRLRERFPRIAKELDQHEQPAVKLHKTYQLLWDSSEERSFKNNSMHMKIVQEKYGYDNDYRFFVNGDVIFLGVINDGRRSIVTVMDKKQHVVPHVRNTNLKYTKRLAVTSRDHPK